MNQKETFECQLLGGRGGGNPYCLNYSTSIQVHENVYYIKAWYLQQIVLQNYILVLENWYKTWIYNTLCCKIKSPYFKIQAHVLATCLLAGCVVICHIYFSQCVTIKKWTFELLKVNCWMLFSLTIINLI